MAKQRAESSETATSEGTDDQFDVSVSDFETGQAGWRSRVLNRSLERAARRSLERGWVFVKAARQLMEERGSAGFTVQEAADRAGQSLRTFYQHFASKDELILAVFEELIERQIARARKDVEKHTEPIDRLAALIVGTAHLAERGVSPLEVALTHYRLQLLESRPDEVAVIQAPYAALVRQMVLEAVEAGQIPPCDPEAAAYFIVTLKSDFLRTFVLGNELGLKTPPAAELARFCLQGLGSQLPPAFEDI